MPRKPLGNYIVESAEHLVYHPQDFRCSCGTKDPLFGVKTRSINRLRQILYLDAMPLDDLRLAYELCFPERKHLSTIKMCQACLQRFLGVCVLTLDKLDTQTMLGLFDMDELFERRWKAREQATEALNHVALIARCIQTHRYDTDEMIAAMNVLI